MHTVSRMSPKPITLLHFKVNCLHLENRLLFATLRLARRPPLHRRTSRPPTFNNLFSHFAHQFPSTDVSLKPSHRLSFPARVHTAREGSWSERIQDSAFSNVTSLATVIGECLEAALKWTQCCRGAGHMSGESSPKQRHFEVVRIGSVWLNSFCKPQSSSCLTTGSV